MRRHPLLIELNARLWLRRLSARHGRPLTLGTLPDHLVKETVAGFDTVWAMGVWSRTPGSRQQALGSHGLTTEFDRVLPGWTAADVGGSPYAIGGYVLDPALGPPHALADLGAQLGAMGRSLIVDFVPNHLALDHPWTLTHPERFMGGTTHDLVRAPEAYFRTDRGVILAHGKDPNFAAWADTVQLNVFRPDTREALIDILMGIAQVAEGVRCDMAMLLLNDVFERTWGWALGNTPRPATEFWEEAIGRVKQRYPTFVFMAEAYWGTEGRLVELGFDYAYDKTFYDRLVHGDAESVRVHFLGQNSFLRHGVRFVENHDEPRAIATFGAARVRGAAVAAATLPGVRLMQDGQLEGKRVRVPVQLIREPTEPRDEELADFHRRLLVLSASLPLQRGRFSPLSVEPTAPDDGHGALVAWAWWVGNVPTVIVLNHGDHPSRGRVRFAAETGLPDELRFSDPFGTEVQVHGGLALAQKGLPVSIGPRQARVFCGLSL